MVREDRWGANDSVTGIADTAGIVILECPGLKPLVQRPDCLEHGYPFSWSGDQAAI